MSAPTQGSRRVPTGCVHVRGRYATVADFVLARGDYMHLPGSHRPVNFEHHHLVTWRAFVASRWSQHYYGQARGS